MKFGIFFEIQCPKPWTETTEVEKFHEAIEQAELADRLGFDTVWCAEHHFLEEYSHNGAPEIFLAAVAARTKNIRIGHGIKHLTTNHPIRVAEQAGALDIISNGRLELGLGEGSGTTELHPFDVRFREKRGIWEDAVRCFLPMMYKDAWEYEGEHFKVPSRNVLPKPVQKPHPPLWVACSQRETIESAARWGMGALGFSFLSAEAAEVWVNSYYDQFLNHAQSLTDYQRNAGIAAAYYFSCAPTDEEAALKADGATFFEFALQLYVKEGPFEAGNSAFWDKYLEWRETEKGQAKQAWVRDNMIVGSPETLRQRIREIEAVHLDQIILLVQTGKTTHEEICSSLELFAKEVMPEFKERDHLHQQWKQDVLSGKIKLDTADTSQHQEDWYQTPGAKRKNVNGEVADS